MRSLIFDATQLIYVTRIGLSRLINEIPTKKFAARSVFREVVEQGKAKGLADALVLQNLFDANAITIIEPSKTSLLHTFTRIKWLEEADAETLAIAKEPGYRAVLDDLLARKVAKSFGIDFVGAPFMLKIAIENEILRKDAAKKAVDDMVEAGWRCGPELYREIIRMLRTSESEFQTPRRWNPVPAERAVSRTGLLRPLSFCCPQQ